MTYIWKNLLPKLLTDCLERVESAHPSVIGVAKSQRRKMKTWCQSCDVGEVCGCLADKRASVEILLTAHTHWWGSRRGCEKIADTCKYACSQSKKKKKMDEGPVPASVQGGAVWQRGEEGTAGTFSSFYFKRPLQKAVVSVMPHFPHWEKMEKSKKKWTRHGVDVGGGGTRAAQFHLLLCSVGFEMENSSKEQSQPSGVKAFCCHPNQFAFNERPWPLQGARLHEHRGGRGCCHV